MTLITLSRGTAQVKDHLTRRDRRELQTRLLSAIPVSREGAFSMNAGALFEAQELTLLYCIERITIAGADRSVTQDTLDDEELLTDEDIGLIKTAVDTLQAKDKEKTEEVKKD